MGTRFVRYHPAVRRNEREKFYFLVAAGMAVSLLLLTILVLHNRQAVATSTAQPVEQAPVEPVRPTIGTVVLLAPEGDVPKGTKLSTVKFKEIYWPRNSVPQGAIRDLSEIQALYAKGDLSADIPLTRVNTSSAPTFGPLPVRSGYRAISIALDDTGVIEGHARPGSHVDVMLTFLENSTKTTKVIVHNARVLSIGGETQDEEDAAPIPGRASLRHRRTPSSTVTLEVIPEDALTIETAKTMGRLGLMMRPVDDTEPMAITEMNTHKVAGDGDAQPRAASKVCSRGNVRLNGSEFTVNCDGTITKVLDPLDP